MSVSALLFPVASCLFTKKLNDGLGIPTPQGQNLPFQPTRNPLGANHPLHQPKGQIVPFSNGDFSFLFLGFGCSVTHNCFLHASTPERRTPVLVRLFTQCEHGHQPDTTQYILQKDLQNAETLGNDSSGAASEPHRFKYIVVGRSVGSEMTLLR